MFNKVGELEHLLDHQEKVIARLTQEVKQLKLRLAYPPINSERIDISSGDEDTSRPIGGHND